jgi:hypothetical protein
MSEQSLGVNIMFADQKARDERRARLEARVGKQGSYTDNQRNNVESQRIA